ncbi:MAG TPA: hypothetical protein VEA69_10840 [Tepidisphaeraceae bacterium]|nr:hypothetical protein [Tepidisphaeraceae bacterium]
MTTTIPAPSPVDRPSVEHAPVDRPARGATPPALRMLAIALLLAGAAHAVWYHMTVRIVPFDDAYIAYRYVDNALAGRGLVYNEGERVMGCTAPLHLAWLAGIKTIVPGVDLPTLAVRLNFVPFLATALALFLVVRRFTGNLFWPTLLTLCLLFHQHMLRVSSGGMEPFFFTTLLLFTFLALLNKRPIVTGLLIGLSMLLRPEGVILVPLAGLAFFGQWRKLAVCALACAIPVGAWVVFAWSYFGTPVPHSVVAKSRPIYPLEKFAALKGVVRQTGEWLSGRRPIALAIGDEAARSIVPGKSVATVVLAAGVLLVALATLLPRVRKTGGYLPGLAFLFLAAMYAKGNPLLFEWYLPFFFVTALLAVTIPMIGLCATLHDKLAAGRGTPGRQFGLALPFRAAAVVWVALIAFSGVAKEEPGFFTAYTVASQPDRARVFAYREAAELINPHRISGDRVTGPEIGALGYYIHGHLLDGCALVSPEALPYHPVPADQRRGPDWGVLPGDLVQDLKPRWVVVMPVFGDISCTDRPSFKANYERWKAVKLAVKCWENTEVEIYKRRE